MLRFTVIVNMQPDCQMRITFEVIANYCGSDSPNFFSTANHFWPIVNHFSNGFAKRPFFSLFVFTPILDPFLDKNLFF